MEVNRNNSEDKAMAGPGNAVWVKVKGKGGRMTTRAIGMTKGGGNFSQGQVITQSEFNEVRKKAAERKNTPSALSNWKGESLLFDTRKYVSKDAVKKERDRAGLKIEDLREERRSMQKEIAYRLETTPTRWRNPRQENNNDVAVARYQSKIVRVNQQIKKLKDIRDGRMAPPRVKKGTVDEMPSVSNRDKTTMNDRLIRVKKAMKR